MTRGQLSLGLALPVSWSREDFLVAAGNEAALGWLDRWPDWPNQALVLHGAAGSGKTHLAHIWAARSHARLIVPADLAKDAVDALARPPLVLDAAHAGADPVALFPSVHLMPQPGPGPLFP